MALLASVLVMVLGACSAKDSGSTDAATGQAPTETGYTALDPGGLQRMMEAEDVYLVNVHVPYEGELPDTDAFIPYTEIADRSDELPFDEQKVVIYCRSGNMSTEAARAMVAVGTPAFYELDGGWYAWQEAGLPFEVNDR